MSDQKPHFSRKHVLEIKDMLDKKPDINVQKEFTLPLAKPTGVRIHTDLSVFNEIQHDSKRRHDRVKLLVDSAHKGPMERLQISHKKRDDFDR